MKILRQCFATFKNLEERMDQWILRNPLAVWRYLKFRSIQKVTYNRKYHNLKNLGRTNKYLAKIFLGGYLISNLYELDLG